MIRPYADSVNRIMNQVIGNVATDLEKKQPEGSLGNLMADAVFAEASRVFSKQVDVAFINYGGIRVAQIPAGPLTLNQVFEMMPFDNLLVVQQLPGSVLQEFLDNIAARGGWPISGGQFVIRNKKATDVLIGGQPLDLNRTYTVVNSDYVANGGDDAAMLRSFPQENRGFLVRDALIHYFKGLTAKGEAITATTSNRVRHAN
ncbi:5'-nucleotidase C-terminal domain-containing protein [Flavihumibacter petaseus]|nr:5'-nucleotidase C-terminal domain-containing protein [Flavihumibacter petaseus]